MHPAAAVEVHAAGAEMVVQLRVVMRRLAAVSAGNERGLGARFSAVRFGGEIGDGGQRGPLAGQYRRTGVG